MDGMGHEDSASLATLPTPGGLGAPADVPPAVTYLASLASLDSRATMRDGLKRAARVLGLPAASWERLPWHTLDAAVLGRLRTLLAEQYAPSTANLTLQAVRGVLRESWRRGLLSGEAWQRVDDVPGVRGERVHDGRALTVDEQRKLLEAAAAGPGLLGPRNVALVGTGLGCGLRRSELVGLTRASFEGETMVVLGKGNKEARVPVPSSLRPLLQGWCALRGDPEGPLFPVCDRQGHAWLPRPLHKVYVGELLSALSERAGIERVMPHDLRRTYGTGLFLAGSDALAVQRLMRHASVTTTSRYDLRSEHELAQVAERLVLPVR